MAIYVPIVMYGLRLFIVVLQELHCLPNCLHVCMIRVAITSPSFVTLYLIVSALPEAVYCCFTRTTLFTELFTCLYDQSLRLLPCHQVSLLYTFWPSMFLS